MKEQIREILWNFVAGEVTDSEAVQQVLDLFAVVGRSKQLNTDLENEVFNNDKDWASNDDVDEYFRSL
jgi:hypothetical protein